jgi:hypothetical protein
MPVRKQFYTEKCATANGVVNKSAEPHVINKIWGGKENTLWNMNFKIFWSYHHSRNKITVAQQTKSSAFMDKNFIAK